MQFLLHARCSRAVGACDLGSATFQMNPTLTHASHAAPRPLFRAVDRAGCVGTPASFPSAWWRQLCARAAAGIAKLAPGVHMPWPRQQAMDLLLSPRSQL